VSSRTFPAAGTGQSWHPAQTCNTVGRHRGPTAASSAIREAGHPIFFSDMWERCQPYLRPCRSVLIRVMNCRWPSPGGPGGLLYAQTPAPLYGLTPVMGLPLSLPGGWVADRITGAAPGVLYGGIPSSPPGQFCLGGGVQYPMAFIFGELCLLLVTDTAL